jgi:hypothetical protein
MDIIEGTDENGVLRAWTRFGFSKKRKECGLCDGTGPPRPSVRYHDGYYDEHRETEIPDGSNKPVLTV